MFDFAIDAMDASNMDPRAMIGVLAFYVFLCLSMLWTATVGSRL